MIHLPQQCLCNLTYHTTELSIRWALGATKRSDKTQHLLCCLVVRAHTIPLIGGIGPFANHICGNAHCLSISGTRQVPTASAETACNCIIGSYLFVTERDFAYIEDQRSTLKTQCSCALLLESAAMPIASLSGKLGW